MIINFKNKIRLWDDETPTRLEETVDVEKIQDMVLIKEQTVELHGKAIDELVTYINDNKTSQISMDLFYSKESKSLVLNIKEIQSC